METDTKEMQERMKKAACEHEERIKKVPDWGVLKVTASLS